MKEPKVLSAVVDPKHNFRWISLKKLTYVDQAGSTRIWECAERTTRPSHGVDGVAVYARLHGGPSSLAPSILLVVQFRPPVGRLTVELPAGLMDAEDADPGVTALRELQEECGYVGQVSSISPVVYADPGMTSANMKLVAVDVDLAKKENQHPVPKPDEGEFIETISVPEALLLEELQRLHTTKGYAIDARLWMLAWALKQANEGGGGGGGGAAEKKAAAVLAESVMALKSMGVSSIQDLDRLLSSNAGFASGFWTGIMVTAAVASAGLYAWARYQKE